jgi:mutator protein MutT
MSSYIMDLRKYVGHKTLLQCAASVIIENEKGEVLLGKRTDNHKWGYAGGSIELDETVEECAKRELFEEMGLIADELEFFMINSGVEAHYIYPNGDEVSNVEIVYICRKYHGEIRRQEEEMEELRFFAVEDFPEEISDPICPVIREYQKMRISKESQKK